MQSQVESHTLKIPTKLYRIGELVSYTPFSRQTIHNYTVMGLIREAHWTKGGHRLYDESVFEKLSRILELKKTRTLWEIRQILRKEETAAKASSAEQTGGAADKTADAHPPPEENRRN